MAHVTLQGVSKQYGRETVLHPTDLEIREGELLALLGPSGCGKTTTLRIVAGFAAPNQGRVLIGQQDVTEVPVHRRKVGMVFQGYALLPHLTVRRNIQFGMRVQKWSAERIAQRTQEMLEWVRLSPLADRLPSQLSGGQQQRVALARAMAVQPAVLLLDEPFSALDTKLRVQMRTEMRAFQREAGITSVLVTHDQEEAMATADRIAVMNQGRVEQLGTPQELYERPASRFAASFLGKCNLIPGRVQSGHSFDMKGGPRLALVPGVEHRGDTLCVRPERCRLGRDPQGAVGLPVTVKGMTYLGSTVEYALVGPGELPLGTCVAAGDDYPIFRPGESGFLSWSMRDAVVLA